MIAVLARQGQAGPPGRRRPDDHRDVYDFTAASQPFSNGLHGCNTGVTNEIQGHCPKTTARTCTLALCNVLLGSFLLLATVTRSLADGNFNSFGDIANAKPTATPSATPTADGKSVAVTLEAQASAEPWGPVKTDKISLANVAPGLLTFFNNGPVFGLPGTVVGDFWQ